MATRPQESSSAASGYNSYSPLSTLERQYAEPVGTRVLLFVRTNPNVYLAGGVESIIKSSSVASPKMSIASTESSATEYSASSMTESDASATGPSLSTSNNGGEGSDPFSFLGEEESAAGENVEDASSSKKRGPNFGRFLKKVAQSTSKTLERGMTNLAIRADGGKSPDWLFVGLYANDGTLLTLTESLAVPMDESKKFQGLRFQVPLTLPGSLPNNDSAMIRVWIRSGAAMLQQRHFLIGQVPLSIGQLRSSPSTPTFMTVTLQSNMVADGKLFLCVAPDSKFPHLCGPGWSLADPDQRTAYGAGGLFHLPLDQAYGMSYPPNPSSWLLATERTVESSVVLPVAAAFANLAAVAGRISLQHAESISMHVHGARHDSTVGEYVDCAFTIGQFKLTPSDNEEMTPSIFCSASWQRPDSIFEVDLMQPVRINSTLPSDARSATSVRFFPKPVREGILPAILQSSGGRLPATGFLLGTVRLAFDVSHSRSENPHNSGVRVVDTWECVLGLEGLLSQQESDDSSTPTTLEFPVFDSARRQRGSVSVALSMKMKQGPALPQRVEAKGGLLSIVGLTPLCDSVQPDLDVVVPESLVGHPERMTRQQQQLATMGTFFTYGYTHFHCSHIRSEDVKELEERRIRYNAALTTPGENVPPHEVKTPKAFRPSSSRSELLLAGLPFNVHSASLSLHVSDQESSIGDKKPDSVFTNVTCGAPADHARGYDNIFPKPKDVNTQAIGLTSPVGAVSGGLRRLEAQRAKIAKYVSDLQVALTMNVANYFVAERQKKNMCNHVPSRNNELQHLRWTLFEAYQSLHHVTWHCAVRRSSSFSQALGLATTSFLASLSDPSKMQYNWPEFWAKHGYLVTFEGLLSAAGKELGMIEDASVGIDMLRFVSVVIRSDDNQSDSKKVPIVASPYLKWVRLSAVHTGLAGTNPEYTLEIGVVPSYYERRIPKSLYDGRPVRFYPLLFEVGVDIRQWGAHQGANMKNKLSKSESGETSSTDQPAVSILDDEDDDGGFADDDVLVELNYEAFNKLNSYAHSINPTNTGASVPKTHPFLENLYQHIVTSKGKISHGILDEAAALCQRLGGGGVVFCKSGKDRTAMHVTFKQAQYANQFRRTNPSQTSGDGNGSQFDDQTTADATVMRIYGTRLPICEKNVGQAKYAFNSLQVKFMPDALKPPMNTLAGFLKGGKVFQGGGIES